MSSLKYFYIKCELCNKEKDEFQIYETRTGSFVCDKCLEKHPEIDITTPNIYE